MAQTAKDQKKQIVKDLQSIPQIANVIALDMVKDIFQIDSPSPFALVPMPHVSRSTKLDSASNDRVYDWNLWIVVDNQTLTSEYDIEELMDAVMDAFDNDETLGGNSWPAVEPTIGQADTITSADKTLTIIPLTIRAHAFIQITP